MLKPDQIIANEQSSIQSASAISSSVKLPTTSTPKEKSTEKEQIDSAAKPNPSFPSISSDDLIPVESIPSLYTDLNTDDELAEINRMEEKIFKMPSPKRSYRTRKSRRDRSGGSGRRLRSRNRENNYKFSDEEESDHQRVTSPTEIWRGEREEEEEEGARTVSGFVRIYLRESRRSLGIVGFQVTDLEFITWTF